MHEKAIRFGKSTPLIGVLSEPPPGVDRERPGIVLLNSGLLHRVGASRLHVQIARKLAPEGFVALRFDFSGIGDSDARKDSLTFEQSAVLETQEAMDYLAGAKGIKRFILMGLCSGADMAFKTAIADPRVVGVLQLDAWAYRTWKFYLRRYGPRLLNGRSWLSFLSGKTYLGPFLRRTLGGSVDGPASGNENLFLSPYARAFPPKSEVEVGMRALVARGVQMLHIFSGGQAEHYNYRAQYEESFRSIDFGGLLIVKYDGTADHVFSALYHQRLVVDSAYEWVMSLWSGGAVASPGARPAAAETIPA